MGESGVSEITGLRTVEVRSLADEARLPVCLGVQVKQTSWGYDFDRVDPFFVYASGMGELKSWARAQKLPVDLASSKHLMEEMKDTLKQVSSSYKIAGQNSPEFMKAALILERINEELPMNTTVIDSYIEEIVLLDRKIPFELTAKNLVLRVLLGVADWRFIE
jgi:antitoxin component of RelBE/YafQ-DinJ toxin-antitoxin module